MIVVRMDNRRHGGRGNESLERTFLGQKQVGHVHAREDETGTAAAFGSATVCVAEAKCAPPAYL